MRKEIIINATANEIRIAITEDKRLAELYVETPEKERMVGDIYLGKVAKVMPGIRAAFIDLGLKQDAFLHFSDIGSSFHEYASLMEDGDSDVDLDEEGDDEETAVAAERSGAAAQEGTGMPAQAGTPAPPPRPYSQSTSSRPQRDQRNNGRSQPSVPDLKRGQEII